LAINLLVGGFNHLEKYEFVNGKDDIPYMKWNIKFMFETTNQNLSEECRSKKTISPTNNMTKQSVLLGNLIHGSSARKTISS
jgi:hypothetical protein